MQSVTTINFSIINNEPRLFLVTCMETAVGAYPAYFCSSSAICLSVGGSSSFPDDGVDEDVEKDLEIKSFIHEQNVDCCYY